MKKQMTLNQINERLDEYLAKTSDYHVYLKYKDKMLSMKDDTIDNLQKENAKKDKLIQDLIHGLYAKNESMQCVIMKPYRGKACVYKDGHQLDTDSTTSVTVDIDGNDVEIIVRN